MLANKLSCYTLLDACKLTLIKKCFQTISLLSSYEHQITTSDSNNGAFDEVRQPFRPVPPPRQCVILTGCIASPPGGTPSVTPETKSSQSLSTVISLLSTLCRGSPAITHDLLRSPLPEAIHSALRGDERSVRVGSEGTRGQSERNQGGGGQEVSQRPQG